MTGYKWHHETQYVCVHIKLNVTQNHRHLILIAILGKSKIEQNLILFAYQGSTRFSFSNFVNTSICTQVSQTYRTTGLREKKTFENILRWTKEHFVTDTFGHNLTS